MNDESGKANKQKLMKADDFDSSTPHTWLVKAAKLLITQFY